MIRWSLGPIVLAFALAPAAASAEAPAPASMARVQARLLADARVGKALAMLREADARTLDEQVAIAQIPAPPFGEATRAADVMRRLEAVGLRAHLDREGNVVAERLGNGNGKGPLLVVSAHLDTVFPSGSDVTVKRDGDRLRGRGLQDDARGLAVVIAVARAMQDARLTTVGDLLFVATVGEEAQGDLRGVKALFLERPDIDGFISVDAANMAQITSRATGSRRWTINFRGPGGHSAADFGRPSAVHALGRAIAAIADLRPPAAPRTTFTVGTASGGASVNAIAAEARAEIDLRSEDAASLARFEAEVLAAVDGAARAENARWSAGSLTVTRTLTGDRPVGATPHDSPLVLGAVAASVALGGAPPRLEAGSSDSNLPMSLGVPAITVAGGGQAGGAHTEGEWYRPTDAWLGPQRVLLTALAMVGLDGAMKPQLPDRNPKAKKVER